ncbi:hypothetical protein [Pseudomonas agarici]|uniref:hypothetical protein n=1 Tax=Pseudomonas agarici TaxID=46677 RepID=UPI000474CBA5|nr:hypothetical protein [Pseudomonas agarici]NWB89584.1 hypothetical protein [Pseudomonas agarici]NWC10356.1 hypothetical protein [Pseudomonas agarici]SEK21898.1 hypothetical protein SAMN05216604_101214 [Pseudomonas agarici]
MIGHRVATDRHQDMLALFQEGETTGYRLQGYLAFGVLASPLADSHFQRLLSFSDATLHAPERSTLYLNVAASCSQALRGLATGL